jgi:hypothetical protein
MIMMFNSRSRQAVKDAANKFVADTKIFPQTLDVLKTRAEVLGIELIVTDVFNYQFDSNTFGLLIQYPNANGEILDYKTLVDKAHQSGAMTGVAADLLSLTLLTPPGEWGADIVFGSTQRFGIPMGYGGPHAAYFAARDEFKRNMPGRIIGVSKVARVGRQKEALHHQLFEIVIIAVPELYDGLRQQRLISIAKNIEAKQPDHADPDMPLGRQRKRLTYQLQIKAEPYLDQRERQLPAEGLLHPRQTESVIMEQRAERTLRIAVKQGCDQFQNYLPQRHQEQELKPAEYRPRIAFRRLCHGPRQVVVTFAGRCIGAIPNRPNVKKMVAKAAALRLAALTRQKHVARAPDQIGKR